MPSPLRRSPIVVASTLLLLLASLVASTAAAPTVSAAGYAVRMEAGPQTGYRFDALGQVTAKRTITLVAPVDVTASGRRTFGVRGPHLFVQGGPLAGWWLRESRVVYAQGAVGTRALPATPVTLPPGRFVVYTFDAAGMRDAAPIAIATSTVLHADRSSVIQGRAYVRLIDGPRPGWWLPGTVAAPTAIRCTAGTATASGTGKLVRSVPSATGRVALTFDMGGRMDPALSIVRFLVLERMCATLFVTGDASRTTQGRAVLALAAAHPELFELGNHTVHHCNLRDGGGGTSACPAARPSDAFVAQELAGTETIVTGISGMTTKPYWRPPYGAVDNHLVAVAAAAGWPRTVLWSLDTIDWRPVKDGGPTAAASIAKVRDGVTAGSIVLMHLGGYTTRDALPGMLQALYRAGYQPTTISGLGA